MSNKWITWHGLTNESPTEKRVNVLLRNGEYILESFHGGNSRNRRWNHEGNNYDIVSYQIIEDEKFNGVPYKDTIAPEDISSKPIKEDFQETPKHSHYHKDVSHLKTIDVYRVIDLWGITSPPLQHAIKKLLVPGGRGAGKDMAKDVQEAIDSLIRWQEMQVEDKEIK